MDSRLRRFCIVAVVATFLTWPWAVGRWIFLAECSYLSGVHIRQFPDARSDGFYDHRLFLQREIYGIGSNNFLQDVKDLIDGRVDYFEIDRLTSPWNVGIQEFTDIKTLPRFQRFFIADKESGDCLKNSYGSLRKFGYSSDEKCIASELTDSIKSRYELRTYGYHHTDTKALTIVLDRTQHMTNRIVATFWSFNHFDPLNFVSGRGGVCPKYADLGYSPHQIIASMVFIDRLGQKKDLKQLKVEYDEKIKRETVRR